MKPGYSTTIAAHRWTFALELLFDKENGADVVSYTACIAACEKAAQWQMLGDDGRCQRS